VSFHLTRNRNREMLMSGKVNYKLAGSGGFSPHIDSTAYTHVKNIKHLTILLAVDDSNMSNGGLEVVEGSHLMDMPINRGDNCLEKGWVDRQTWVPVELEAGMSQVLLTISYD
jgi:ectoine hydroxylase-related dioxygenase (phytanoyl-CoA dioxygenase family)